MEPTRDNNGLREVYQRLTALETEMRVKDEINKKMRNYILLLFTILAGILGAVGWLLQNHVQLSIK